jgi:hypothetical protein
MTTTAPTALRLVLAQSLAGLVAAGFVVRMSAPDLRTREFVALSAHPRAGGRNGRERGAGLSLEVAVGDLVLALSRGFGRIELGEAGEETWALLSCAVGWYASITLRPGNGCTIELDDGRRVEGDTFAEAVRALARQHARDVEEEAARRG